MLKQLLGGQTISSKIISILLIASNASFVLTFAMIVLSDAVVVKNIFREGFLNSERVVIDQLGNYLGENNRGLVEDILGLYSTNAVLIEISVFDNTNPAQAYAKRTLLDASDQSFLWHLATLELEIPLTDVQQVNVGTLYISVYSDAVQNLIEQMFVLFLVMMVLSNLTGIYLSIYLRRRISDPILSLAEISHQVTNYNDYRLRAEVHSDDEIGLLSENFNKMLEQIQLRDTMLADKVEQRTDELKKLNDRLRYDANHDILTGLPNRNLFSDRANQALKDSDRNKNKAAIFFIDLDNFKTINDTLGHDVGDQLLQIVAQRLQNVVRKNDTVSRFGGDEFNILLRDINHVESAALIAGKILDELQKPIQVETHMLNVTASLGMAIYPDDAKNVTLLQQHADTAMYSAKELGKNKYQIYNENLNIKNNERLTIINDLRSAIKNEEFQLVYQPKVDAQDDTIFGLETLIRWHHPERGLLMPDRFIPFAEESGIIVDIDLWVLRTACKQVQTWNQKYQRNMTLAVNMSSHHFSDHHFIDVLHDLLTETEMPAELLEFELTERVLVDSSDVTMANLKALKALGARLSIDDFGTGYSSLNYLRKFPIDIVKIDKSFISDLTLEPDDATLTLAMILLAKSLSLDVIAEGVETAAQREMLLAYGCNLMQGYYFYKPLDVKTAEAEVFQNNQPKNNLVYLNSANS